MADSGFGLSGDGLAEVAWEACDAPVAGRLLASPADARGRGILLTVTRGGEAVNLTGASVYLLWRHREARTRGCEPFEAVDAAAGRFRVFWPAAMACAEGTVDAQVMVCSGGESVSSLPFSVRVCERLTGGAGGGDDGYSMFLVALERIEEADSLIAGAVAKAEAAAEAASGAAAAVDAAETAAADAVKAKDDLLAAAERGDFDGSPGAPGEPGRDGVDGLPGKDGLDGKDGVSPSASVEQTDEGAVVTVTDAAGTTWATLLHGEKGDKGDPGEAGERGEKGDAFTYADFTAEQLEALRGPQGLPGADGALPEFKFTDEQAIVYADDVIIPSDPGAYDVGDLVFTSNGGLARVESVDEGDGREYANCVKLAHLRGSCLLLSDDPAMDAEPQAFTEVAGTVEGVLPSYDDVVLNTATGCVLTVLSPFIDRSDPYRAKVVGRGICRLATRSYVDDAVAGIAAPDLSAYATREYVDGAVAGVPAPDLTAYATKEYVDAAIVALEDLSGKVF